jgi:hypothetical protein
MLKRGGLLGCKSKVVAAALALVANAAQDSAAAAVRGRNLNFMWFSPSCD